MTQRQRYSQILAYFQETQPAPQTELHYDSPFQLLVATILSAQCTDKRVNSVTPALFQAYPTAQAMATATADDLLVYIHTVSYPNSKSRHMATMARQLVTQYGGEVPTDVDELQTLSGVGRKTANVVASVAFHQPVLAVDTHVFRVANRIGLTHNATTPLQTERELTRHIPRHLIAIAHHWLLLHGRYVCTARKPHCDTCAISHLCVTYEQSVASQQPTKTSKR